MTLSNNRKSLEVQDNLEKRLIESLQTRLRNLPAVSSRSHLTVTYEENLKIHWMVAYKKATDLTWKKVFQRTSLGMIFTREYKRVLWKLHDFKNKNRPPAEFIKFIEDVSKYDAKKLSASQRLDEVKYFYPELVRDEEFISLYLTLYKYQIERYVDVKPDIIKEHLYSHFGINNSGDDIETLEIIEVQKPEIKMTEVETPLIQRPKVKRLEALNAEINTPTVQRPIVKKRQIQNSDINTPTVQRPIVKKREIQNNEINTPTVKKHEIQNSEIKTPEIQRPISKKWKSKKSDTNLVDIVTPDIIVTGNVTPDVQEVITIKRPASQEVSNIIKPDFKEKPETQEIFKQYEIRKSSFNTEEVSNKSKSSLGNNESIPNTLENKENEISENTFANLSIHTADNKKISRFCPDLVSVDEFPMFKNQNICNERLMRLEKILLMNDEVTVSFLFAHLGMKQLSATKEVFNKFLDKLADLKIIQIFKKSKWYVVRLY